MKKTDLRRYYLEKRNHLTLLAYNYLNQQILFQLTKINWHLYKIVHVFLPISKLKEIDTFLVISYLNKTFPHLEIVVSKTDFEKMTMDHFLFNTNESVLALNKLNIPEPAGGKLIQTELIDAVLVPLLAFDKKGQRVGYGKGFYDRFLAQCRPDTLKIGLSFFDPVDEITDAEELDIKLDRCICPDKIWNF